MMKRSCMLLLGTILVWATPVLAGNVTVSGDMGSAIRYELQEQVTAGDGMKKLVLSFVVPQTYESPTYRQKISNFNLTFRPSPQDRKESLDERGNRVVVATWDDPPANVDVRLSCDAANTTNLKVLETRTPFPLTDVDPKVKVFLRPTDQVQVNHPRIRELSDRLTSGVKTEFDAVQRVISWVVDNVRYVTPPAQYDAVYSLESGKGNCQNYSHLSAALLRSVGIPVRIVNGVTLDRSYDVKWQKGVMTFKMGKGTPFLDRGLVSRSRMGSLRSPEHGPFRIQPLHPHRGRDGQQRDQERRADALVPGGNRPPEAVAPRGHRRLVRQ